MEATVIGSLFQKLMILTKKDYLYTLIREYLHISVKWWDLEEEFLNWKKSEILLRVSDVVSHEKTSAILAIFETSYIKCVNTQSL